MSTSVRQRNEDRGVDLGTGVSWPLVFTAGGLGVLVLGTGIVLAVLAALRPAPAPDPVLAQQGKSFHLPELSDPPPRPRVSHPIEVAEPEPPELLPRPAIVAPELASVVRLIEPPAPAAPPPVRLVESLSPAPAKVAPAAGSLPTIAYKRRYPYYEDELRGWLLAEAKDLDIETEKGTRKNLLQGVKSATGSKDQAVAAKDDSSKQQAKTAPILELIAQRDDLKGLPVRNVAECQADPKEAKVMGALSLKIRDTTGKVSRKRDLGSSPGAMAERDVELVKILDKELKGEEGRSDVGVRILVQMLQAETDGVRHHLVKMLAATKGKAASVALAQRAVFELNIDVREAAVKALKDRPREEYRPVLLEALRYPWHPVADRAAEVLVAVDDRDAVFDLAALLDQPDPRAPTQDKDNKWVVTEVVRVNHLGNCLLCHAPSSAKDDPMRGVVPERGKPLPEVYYQSSSGDFVRADVTYLRQDFSLVLPVEKPEKWPTQQRFDYLLRKRALTADEVSHLGSAKDAPKAKAIGYPGGAAPAHQPHPTKDVAKGKAPFYLQREAVLWTLRELTGKDAGDKSEDWHLLLFKESVGGDW
jgi:hypothetical protein